MTVVLSTAYFPPVTWFSVAAGNKNVLIEKHENFKKQTYRNRCEILSSNGRLSLTVPIVKNHGLKTPVDKVKIDYSAPWQRIHLNAIRSAYGKTPYFIHYYDGIKEIIESGADNLWDLNNNTIKFFSEMFGIDFPGFTSGFLRDYPTGCDFRNIISPKATTHSYSHKEYIQAFSEKFGFVAGLSVLDLLFNSGPDSIEFITK